MLTGKNVIIISSNQLQCLGLKSILEEYFYPDKILIGTDIPDADLSKDAYYIFMPSDVYLANGSHLKITRNRIILFTNYETENGIQDGPEILNITLPQAEIIDRLKIIFQKNFKGKGKIQSEMLSPREIDVLRLVARGYINKQIAEKLFISLHTVISHRKNITRKLGIKTVSGLTVYALLNGLVTSKEIS